MLICVMTIENTFQKSRFLRDWVGVRPGRRRVRLEKEHIAFGDKIVTVRMHLNLSYIVNGIKMDSNELLRVTELWCVLCFQLIEK